MSSAVAPKIIIGTHGQVGTALLRIFTERGVSVWCTSRKFTKDTEATGKFFLDLQNRDSIRYLFSKFAEKFPNTKTEVYLTGALTHVDRCEQEKETCFAMNVQGPDWVAEECAKFGHKLSYYSSEYVFGGAEYTGGAKGPFVEEDPVNPTSEYGKSKVEAEKKILARATKDWQPLILRTTMVFSYEPEGMNFVIQIMRYLKNALAGTATQRFKIPVDQISTPTYAPALAAANILLVEKNESGIFHLVGEDLLSRKEFVEKIIRTFGFPYEKSMAQFDFLKTAELKQPALRPLTAGLSTAKAKKCGARIWTLEEAFNDFKSLQQKDHQ